MASKPVALTEDQLKEGNAKALLALLESISADGRLTDAEILQLDTWLKQSREEKIPAFTYLRGKIEGVLADRIIIEDERRSIVAAILRVMPQESSARARARFNEASDLDREARSFELKSQHETEPVTEEQKRCLRALGREAPENCTRAEALELIDKAMGAGQPPTNRQMMVLRFWNRLDLAPKGRMGVAEWLDAWYAEDPDRLTAWTIWKEEHNEVGRQDPPDRVPLDVGAAYLDRVKVLSPGLNPEREKSPLYVRIAAMVLVVGAIVALYFMLR